MKLILFFIVAISGILCSPNNLCKPGKNYLKTHIDTTKEYNLKGTYCITSVKDTGIDKDSCVISFSVFDRINGKRIKDGVIWFYAKDSTSIKISKDLYTQKIKTGDVVIEAWGVSYIGTKTRKLEIKGSTKMEINFYLGTTLEF